jgi:hypothetical protein
MDAQLNQPELRSERGGGLRAIRLATLGALTIAAWAGCGPPAQAANCTTGTPSNFIEIAYTSLEGHPTETTESFPPSPVALDLSRDVPRVATAETIVDSRGVVRTIFEAAPAEDDLGHGFSIGPHSVRAIIDDTACFVGHGTITYGFHIVGTGVLPNPPLNNPLLVSYDKVFATLSGFGQAQQGAHAWFANQPLETFTLEFPGEPFGVDLTVQQTFTVNGTAAAPDIRPFTFELGVDGVNGASLNVFDTAQAFAVLPPGVSIVTAGGFSAVGGAPAVPEPSTALLLGTAALLIWRSRRTGCADGSSRLA